MNIIKRKINWYSWNIYKLKKSIVNDIKDEVKNNLDVKDINNIIIDYIFLCFLLGNDFLENIPSLKIKENGITVLLKYYILVLCKRKTFLIDLDAQLKECINLEMD